jgi:2-keto-4-pentenoate hydratase
VNERVLSDDLVAAIARDLAEALASRRPVPPLTEQHPGISVADAYAVQELVARARIEAGETVVGWKLGLTSAAMQQQLGVDRPDYGPLLTGHVVPPDGIVPIGALIAPRIEAEIAFVLGRPLRGPGVTRDDVLAATTGVTASLEVIDSRVADWRIRLADTIADMASSARIVVSDARTPVEDVDLLTERVVLERNGQVVAEGVGAAVLGDPVEAVAWAANTLGPLGVTLEPGHVVMPGAMHASVPVVAGDTIVARFERLGSVGVSFG